MRRKLLWVAFAGYCAVMVWLLFGQRFGQLPEGNYLQLLRENLVLRPFDTIGRFWWAIHHSPQPGIRTHAMINLVGNVAMFAPLGYFLPAVWAKLRSFWRCLPLCLAVIMGVEVVQLVTLLGKCDVDDLILNLVGAFLGWCVYRLTKTGKN